MPRFDKSELFLYIAAFMFFVFLWLMALLDDTSHLLVISACCVLSSFFTDNMTHVFGVGIVLTLLLNFDSFFVENATMSSAAIASPGNVEPVAPTAQIKPAGLFGTDIMSIRPGSVGGDSKEIMFESLRSYITK